MTSKKNIVNKTMKLVAHVQLIVGYTLMMLCCDIYLLANKLCFKWASLVSEVLTCELVE